MPKIPYNTRHFNDDAVISAIRQPLPRISAESRRGSAHRPGPRLIDRGGKRGTPESGVKMHKREKTLAPAFPGRAGNKNPPSCPASCGPGPGVDPLPGDPPSRPGASPFGGIRGPRSTHARSPAAVRPFSCPRSQETRNEAERRPCSGSAVAASGIRLVPRPRPRPGGPSGVRYPIRRRAGSGPVLNHGWHGLHG